MNITITKELLGTHNIENYGFLLLGRMYKIFDPNNLFGQFFYHKDVSFFAYNSEDIKITNVESSKDWTPIYKLIDQKTKMEIGQYKSSKIIGASFPLDNLIIGNEQYSFNHPTINTYFN